MKKIKLNLNIVIFTLISLSILSRLFAVEFFSDTRLDNEWGKLVHNLEISGILGINVVVNEFLAIHKFADINDKVIPSVFMPPLYSYFIFFIKFILPNSFDLVKSVIFTQIILSLISILIFFKIIRKFENNFTSLLTTMIFSIFPIYVYSNVQISSITLQVFLLVIFFYYLTNLIEKENLVDLLLFSFFSGLLILIRGEFIVFYFITIFYFFFFFKKNIRFFIFSIIFVALIISPYIKRNYNYFNTFVITKSFGYNILKGNNPHLKVEGSADYINDNYNQEDLKIETNNDYEIKLDNFYKQKALNIIKDDPYEYLILYIKKCISFLFYDFNSSYPGYYNFLNIFPKIILSIFSFFGALIALKRKSFFQYLSIYYFSNIFLFSIFFILPRYSLILLPVQLLLSINSIRFIYLKFLQLIHK